MVDICVTFSKIQMIFFSETLQQKDLAEADIPYIMHILGDVEGMPPGGGLSSK